MNSDDILNQSLGIVPTPVANTLEPHPDCVPLGNSSDYHPDCVPLIPTAANTNLVVQPTNPGNTELQNDYAFARTNLYDILAKGSAALDDLVEIAKQSQHPRAYEVLATLIKNLADTNDKLLGIQKDLKNLKDEDDDSPASPINVANAVFVGTTSELLQLTKKK